MTARTSSGVGRLLDDLGTALVEIVAGPIGGEPIRDVAIHDALEPGEVRADTILLGVGLRSADELCAVLDRGRMAALVVRESFAIDGAVLAAAAGARTPVLALKPGVSWAEFSQLVRPFIALDGLGKELQPPARVPTGDLFGLANAICALVGAPVTIEGVDLKVLAFSDGQQYADESRFETIIGRAVPERCREELHRSGVLRRVYCTDEPVDVTGVPGAALERVAVRVGAGEEVLGSIWVAVADGLSVERRQVLSEMSKVVALHLLQARVTTDVEQRLRSELVARLLDGGPQAADAARRLRLGRGPFCVVALAMGSGEGGQSPAAEAAYQRTCGALTAYLSAVHPRAVTGVVDGVMYVVLPASGLSEDDERAAGVLANQLLERTGGRDQAVLIGVGTVVTDRDGLPRSRADVDRVLRVLRTRGAGAHAAGVAEVFAEALLLELGSLVTEDHGSLSGPVTRLADYDRKHGTRLVESLSAWLDSFGDVPRAAASVHVHPNTFRYRLRRLAEIGRIDLNDPEARFAAMLRLRLRLQLPAAQSRPRGGRGHGSTTS